MTKIETVLLTGKTHTKFSGRGGRVDLNLSTAKGAGDDIAFPAVQAHPTAEQLFAGAWSACYISAIGLVAQAKKVTLPADLSVDIEVDLGMTGDAYFLQARFDVSVPGVAREVAEALAHEAHEICPYSKATRGNIDVVVNVV
ncbi:Ohr family peroxiredoxin [Paraburkholderia phytofirmans]|jgi:osmotically inducible protein OsmC|uniref:Ohr family peroxiredoxin n=1 Tax=Paraburkholderia sp. BL9I2N2 TaxID=1938809 RepID=UPI001048C7EE|nr:Ohr family peroxiredoxin [Paraburkholderia sp. BL9I2N2]TCK91997.1 Ohr subfamily peroxiredoxin [Paraburkholderia sp. BL9I2N2]